MVFKEGEVRLSKWQVSDKVSNVFGLGSLGDELQAVNTFTDRDFKGVGEDDTGSVAKIKFGRRRSPATLSQPAI